MWRTGADQTKEMSMGYLKIKELVPFGFEGADDGGCFFFLVACFFPYSSSAYVASSSSLSPWSS
jgi:hypothetical protein